MKSVQVGKCLSVQVKEVAECEIYFAKAKWR